MSFLEDSSWSGCAKHACKLKHEGVPLLATFTGRVLNTASIPFSKLKWLLSLWRMDHGTLTGGRIHSYYNFDSPPTTIILRIYLPLIIMGYNRTVPILNIKDTWLR
ncbi:hypothetical protein J6590_088212 [Homalodisca vitripennis]|nr:hypothetical protein J6590_088212 [Homalodisca vitripennis]